MASAASRAVGRRRWRGLGLRFAFAVMRGVLGLAAIAMCLTGRPKSAAGGAGAH